MRSSVARGSYAFGSIESEWRLHSILLTKNHKVQTMSLRPLACFCYNNGMPTYEFRCKACSEILRLTLAFGTKELPACPVCGGETQKILTPPMTIFKGTGFYSTDSRSPAKPLGNNTETTSTPSSTPPAEKNTSDAPPPPPPPPPSPAHGTSAKQ